MVRIRKRNLDGRASSDEALRLAFIAIAEWTSKQLGDSAARCVRLDASDGDQFTPTAAAAASSEVDDARLTVVHGHLDMWSPLAGEPHVRTTVRFTKSPPRVLDVSIWGTDVDASSTAETTIKSLLQQHA